MMTWFVTARTGFVPGWHEVLKDLVGSNWVRLGSNWVRSKVKLLIQCDFLASFFQLSHFPNFPSNPSIPHFCDASRPRMAHIGTPSLKSQHNSIEWWFLRVEPARSQGSAVIRAQIRAPWRAQLALQIPDFRAKRVASI